jgi:hypothetical protein
MIVQIRKNHDGSVLDGWIADGNTTIALWADEDFKKVNEEIFELKLKQHAEQFVWAAFDLVGRDKLEQILEDYDR